MLHLKYHQEILSGKHGEPKEEISKFIEDNVRMERVESLSERESPSKWRCRACPKKFKGHRYIVKHVLTKHEDAVQGGDFRGECEEEQFRENFLRGWR